PPCAPPRPPIPAGAGLAPALARGLDSAAAFRFGQAAAAISVTRLGAQTSIPSREEVERALAGEA
ncbi:hypothetical protein I5K76_17175, partial [Pseudomonas aeruginosa]|nr:hypothetical protein [Pseudomonas aeruginosa]